MQSAPFDTDPFSKRVDSYRHRVEKLMDEFVASRTQDDRLGDAIRYAVASEGKRIRPLLSYATAEMLAVPIAVADYPAAAIELIHTYSLVHDDLPAMDDDDLRRGRPTVHKKFDEATGVLVGDALLTYAFELLSNAQVDSALIVDWIRQLSVAAGAQGMVAGQATDLAGEKTTHSIETLEQMHRQKSGALIEACLSMVTSVAKPSADPLVGFGHHIGLAFQIKDDILDVEATTEQLGKPQGSDLANNKSTFVSLLGLDLAKQKMQQEQDAARACLQSYGAEAEGLKWIADYIVGRSF